MDGKLMTVETGRIGGPPNLTQPLFSVCSGETREGILWAGNSIADQVPKEYDPA